MSSYRRYPANPNYLTWICGHQASVIVISIKLTLLCFVKILKKIVIKFIDDIGSRFMIIGRDKSGVGGKLG